MSTKNTQLIENLKAGGYEIEELEHFGGFHLVEPMTEEMVELINRELKVEFDELAYDDTRNNSPSPNPSRGDIHLASHASSKSIGNVSHTARAAEARAKRMEDCPLLKEVRMNSELAEARLKAARGKDFPDEVKPQDQYKFINLSSADVEAALDELFLELKESTNTKGERKHMSRATLFKQGGSTDFVGAVRIGVGALLYSRWSNSKSKVDKLFSICSRNSYGEDFLDWYYNYQHYSSSDVHQVYSELLEKFLEKSLDC